MNSFTRNRTVAALAAAICVFVGTTLPAAAEIIRVTADGTGDGSS